MPEGLHYLVVKYMYMYMVGLTHMTNMYVCMCTYIILIVVTWFIRKYGHYTTQGAIPYDNYG